TTKDAYATWVSKNRTAMNTMTETYAREYEVCRTVKEIKDSLKKAYVFSKPKGSRHEAIIRLSHARAVEGGRPRVMMCRNTMTETYAREYEVCRNTMTETREAVEGGRPRAMTRELDAAKMTFDTPTQTTLYFFSTLSASWDIFTANLVSRETQLAFDEVVYFLEAEEERTARKVHVVKCSPDESKVEGKAWTTTHLAQEAYLALG
ncbi:hypothetical protein AMTR_s00321p00003480, partial [Amborella trichopoda]